MIPTYQQLGGAPHFHTDTQCLIRSAELVCLNWFVYKNILISEPLANTGKILNRQMDVQTARLSPFHSKQEIAVGDWKYMYTQVANLMGFRAKHKERSLLSI